MKIEDFFEQNGKTAIAFSGGVDSSVLLLLAKKYAKRVKAYYVNSQFQPAFEFEDAKKIAKQLNADLEIIDIDVLSDEKIVNNPENRCYFCKKRIFSEIIKRAESDGFETIIEGTNASDDISDRPGFKALGELGVLSPLRECGYTKADIRALAEKNKIPVANKPSYACLATRIPAGEIITADKLKTTEEAENLMRNAGYNNFRIRYNNGCAKLEMSKADMELFSKTKAKTLSLLEPYYKSICNDVKERADE